MQIKLCFWFYFHPVLFSFTAVLDTSLLANHSLSGTCLLYYKILYGKYCAFCRYICIANIESYIGTHGQRKEITEVSKEEVNLNLKGMPTLWDMTELQHKWIWEMNH